MKRNFKKAGQLNPAQQRLYHLHSEGTEDAMSAAARLILDDNEHWMLGIKILSLNPHEQAFDVLKNGLDQKPEPTLNKLIGPLNFESHRAPREVLGWTCDHKPNSVPLALEVMMKTLHRADNKYGPNEYIPFAARRVKKLLEEIESEQLDLGAYEYPTLDLFRTAILRVQSAQERCAFLDETSCLLIAPTLSEINERLEDLRTKNTPQLQSAML